MEDAQIRHDLLEIVIHEMIHLIYPNENHGPRFQMACKKVHEVREDLHITTTYKIEEHAYKVAEKKEPKYILKCPKCGKEWHYNRMNDHVRYPYRYLCKGCQEELVRIK